MICDRCGAPAREKWITSKKNGKQHKLFECTGQCMDGRFPYSFFPPRDSGHVAAPQGRGFVPPANQGGYQQQPPQQGQNVPPPVSSNRNTEMLADILVRIKRLDEQITAMRKQLGATAFTQDELKPDEDVPF